MHTVCLGVIKKLLEYLFLPKYSNQKFSLYKFIDKIDSDLVKIRTPKFIPRVPRSLKNISIWKSNEFLTFLIYFALPLLRGYMELDQFNHLINLVVAMEYLLKKQINYLDLDNINQLLRDFVRDMAYFYGDRAMSSGVHELLHLTDDYKNILPLNELNCFPFENLNGLFLKGVNGCNLVGIEIINTFDAMRCFNLIEPVNLKLEKKASDSFFKAGKVLNSRIISDKELKIIKNNCFQDFIITSFIKIKNVSYTSLLYKKTKKMDYCIKYGNKFGLIKYFIYNQNFCYAICFLLSDLHNPFFNYKYKNLISGTTICTKIPDTIFCADIRNIRKCFYIVANNIIYVSESSTGHFFN